MRSNFRVSLFFSRYFAINIMTVYAMEWECENTRKSENHAKIDIARQYQESAQAARRKSHTESTEITEKDIAGAISRIREIREIRVRNKISVISASYVFYKIYLVKKYVSE